MRRADAYAPLSASLDRGGGIANGVPLGLQIVGKPWDEESVLRLAYRYQNASMHAEKRPLL